MVEAASEEIRVFAMKVFMCSGCGIVYDSAGGTCGNCQTSLQDAIVLLADSIDEEKIRLVITSPLEEYNDEQ